MFPRESPASLRRARWRPRSLARLEGPSAGLTASSLGLSTAAAVEMSGTRGTPRRAAPLRYPIAPIAASRSAKQGAVPSSRASWPRTRRGSPLQAGWSQDGERPNADGGDVCDSVTG